MNNYSDAAVSLNKVSFYLGQRQYTWLIDTGASLSVIRTDVLRSLHIPFHKETLRVNGIGGTVISEGYVYLKLQANNQCFDHKFFIFENLPCYTDGILGQDFLIKHKAVLNYELNKLTLTTNFGNSIELPFKYVNKHKHFSLTLPARSESIHYIDTTWIGDHVVNSQEICEGVFLANTISRSKNGKIPIKLLNIRENDVTISNFNPNVTKLEEYYVCQFNKSNINSDRVKKLFSHLNLKNLTLEEQKSIENICAKFPDVFHLPGDKLSTTPLYEHTIELKPHTTPVYTKPYRLPQTQKTEIDTQIQRMLDDGIIEECRSAWSSPLLLVPKKLDSLGIKKWRVVIDYRKLNEKIQDDKFPLPNISDILDSLSGAVYFTHLDLYQGFYQLNLHSHSRPYTAFTTGKNQFQMTRLPMGLKTSPSAFSRMITVAMSGLNYEKCMVYQDDLICFGRSLENHNKNLMDILARLRKVNLKLNPSKCTFLKKEILYLGHVVSEKGVLPDPEKTKVLHNYPTPQNSDDVKRFVAFANYYRKFIPNFAYIAFPLNKLCCKNTPFIWTEQCAKSYETLKKSLSSPPVLQYPNFSQENTFILQTDASGIAIGSVLCNSDGRPVAYASRSLNKAEINYPTIEKELLSIVWSVKHFRPYLYGRFFKIQTDHRPLVYLFGMRDPTSRLLKFRLQLEEYNFSIEYIKGKENSAADALSRIVMTSEELKSMNEQVMNVITRGQARRMKDLQNKPNTLNSSANNNISNSRTDQPRIVEIIKKPINLVELALTNNRKLLKLEQDGLITERSNYFVYVPSVSIVYFNSLSRSPLARDALVRDLASLCKHIKVEELCVLKNENNNEFIAGIIDEIKHCENWAGPKICVLRKVQKLFNKDDIRVVINDFHLLPTSGHAGIRRMTNNIKRFYYWPGMDKDILEFVNKCSQCKMQKYSRNTKQPMEITSTSNYAFEKIFLDIVGPLPKDDNNYVYVLTLQCELSKYIEAYPLHSKDSESVARAFVRNFILRYGIPREIATDRGSEFISATMKQVCTLLNINQISSTAYHHESIGALENMHKSMGSYLRIQCENKTGSWSSWLPFWCFSYNNTVHSETTYTPHELVFGKSCILPSNLNSNTIDPLYNYDSYPSELKYRLQVAQKEARENLINSKIKRKIIYDSSANPTFYKNNTSYLLLKNETGNKFEKVYNGPYLVLEDLGCNVKILKNGKPEVVHKNRTKLFVQDVSK